MIDGREYIMRYDHGLDVMVSADEPIEIVRCKDCKFAYNEMAVGLDDYEPTPDGKLDCVKFGGWDYYNDIPGIYLVGHDDFCSWGERKND